MKKILFTIICVLIVSISWGQSIKRDNARNNQLKSMVFQQWRFTPKWYYYPWALDNPTGLGLHSNYVETDRRTILQLTPTNATTKVSKSEWEKAHDAENVMYEQEMKLLADRTIDTEYLLKKEDLDFLKGKLGDEMGMFADNGITLAIAEPLYAEYDRITKNIGIIQNSHLENAKRRIAYQSIEEELIELTEICHSVNNMYKQIKKSQKK